MKACRVDEAQLAEWIDGATGAIRYLGPAITEKLAQKILAAEKRTGQCNLVMIDLDDEVERSGYGQTSGVRTLHDERITIQHRTGLRIAALSAPGIGVVWSPIAERVDPIEQVSVNGIWMEDTERGEFQRWMSRMMGEQVSSAPDGESPSTIAGSPQSTSGSDRPLFVDEKGMIREMEPETINEHLIPTEPIVRVSELDDVRIKTVETHLREHPPRDFKQEKLTQVYQDYVGFIEIHVTGSSLSNATTLAVPKELTELGLESDLRSRLSERMRIDLSDTVDLGAGDVNKHVDAFKTMFTKQLGVPLGRIYKKREWEIMLDKWAEIEDLVQAANDKIRRHMLAAVEKVIQDAARDWAKAINESQDAREQVSYTEEEIRALLMKQWHRKQRATHVKVRMFAKDLTWATLNDQEVRAKIEHAYSDLCETGLYKSRCAWAP